MRTFVRYFFTILILFFYSFILSDSSNKTRRLKEGFLKDTQILTAHGYRPIETIKQYDIIVGVDDQGNKVQQLVQQVKQEKVKKYIRLVFDGHIVEAAPRQRFLNATKKQWICAKQLVSKPNISINNTDNISAERVKKKALVYRLTVSGHQFHVTPKNILVHNASVAVAQAGRIAMQYLTLLEPIQTTLGASISLNAISDSRSKQNPLLNQIERCINRPLAKKDYSAYKLEARDTYLRFRQELIHLRDQFVQIKIDIENYTHQFNSLSSLNYALNSINLTLESINHPSLDQEKNFTIQQAQELQQLREFEIKGLEKQIKDLQIGIGVHFEALLNQFRDVSDRYEELSKGLTQFIDNAPKTIPMILECFDRVVDCEFHLKKLEDHIKVIKTIFGYYKNSSHAHILRETSNINDFLNYETQISDYEKDVEDNKGWIQRVKSITASELCKCGINIYEREEQKTSYFIAQGNYLKSQMLQDIEKKRLTFHYPQAENNKNIVFTQDDKDTTKQERQKTILEDLLKNAKPGEKTSGGSKQFELPGGYEEAVKTFDELELKEIKDIPHGMRGTLQDGRIVNVRYKSSDKRPTLEIFNPDTRKSIKFRYGTKGT